MILKRYLLIGLSFGYYNYAHSMGYTSFDQLGFYTMKTIQDQIEQESEYPVLEMAGLPFEQLYQLVTTIKIDKQINLNDMQVAMDFYCLLSAHYQIGKIFYKNKQLDIAINWFEQLLRLARFAPAYKGLYAGASYFLAEIFWNKRTAENFIQAIFYLDRLEHYQSKNAKDIDPFIHSLIEAESDMYAFTDRHRLLIFRCALDHTHYLSNHTSSSYIPTLTIKAGEWKKYMRLKLIDELRLYQSQYPKELESCHKIIDLLTTETSCFERSFMRPGHITASAWLLNFDCTRVLLMHHAKLNKWLQPGGHCDGNPDTLMVAIKEAREESGIQSIEPVSESILDVDIHLIPERSHEPTHFHYDIRYLLKTGNDATIVKNHESNDIAWFALDRLKFPTHEPSVVRMFDKWELLFKRDK